MGSKETSDMISFRSDILKQAYEQYKTEPEYLWMKYPGYAILRHADNQKWYGILMDIPRDRLDLPGDGYVDILDIKVDPDLAGSLLLEEGIFPGYHMNKGHWITVLLDGTVDLELIFSLLDMSFQLTGRKVKGKQNGPRNTKWIVPANPSYFDIEAVIAKGAGTQFLWKQSNHIAVGDTVYLYVAAPVSAIRCKCKAVEVDIPHTSKNPNVRMSRAMRLQLAERYDQTPVGLDVLKRHGVSSVRGPRSIPAGLIREIESLYPDQ